MSLYNEYRPKTLEEMVGNEATIKAIREHFTQSDPKRISHCHLLSGPAGCGKAQPLYSKVLTPSGWKAMGDVHAGDTVLSGDGTPTEVLSVFPQGKRPVYAIGLDDGTEFEVADNHLNVVKYRARGKYHGEVCYADCTDVVTTLDLIDMVNAANRSRNKYKNGIRIPNVYVEGPESSDLPIDPYLLGVLIGDGCLNSAFNVSLPEADVRTRVESLLKDEGFVLHKSNPNDPEDYDYRIVRDTERYERVQDLKDDPDSLRNRIRDLELDVKSVDKHIPEEYLLASYRDRLELLRGLFDTDGSVAMGMSKNRYETISYEFSTSSENLSRDFAELVRSLGITDTVKSRIPYYTDANGNRIECHINYRHHLKVPNGLLIAHSDKHLARIKDRECGERLSRRIRYVRYVGDVECQCIYVKAECHTYITDNHTLTHNTTIARAISTELLGADPQFSITEINTADNRGIDTAREIMEQMRMMPLNGKPMVWIMDECFPGDTEVLTDQGFKRFDLLDGSEKIAQYNADGTVEFVVPLRHIRKKHSGDMYKWNVFHDRPICMTPNHVQPLVVKNGTIKEEYIKDIKFNQKKKVIVSAQGTGTKQHLTAMDKLAILSQADGAINWSGINANRWVISFKKERKIKRFLDIIKEVEAEGFDVNLTKIINPRPGYVRYTYSTPKSITKVLTTHFDLDISYTYAREYIDELMEWDGYRQKNSNGLYYSSVKKENVDFCNAVAFLGGYRSNISVEKDNRQENFSDVYRLFINEETLHTADLGKKTKTVENFDGMVYCVEVPSHMIVVRAGGRFPFVTGNCHGLTAEAKRAFLKPAEECPDHVFFFFCTTNLQQFLKGDEGKALGTRCTQWKLEPLAPRQLGRLVDDVAAKEKFDLDADVLSAIVDSADGSPRAALVALEKVMSTDGKEKQLKLLEGFTNDDPDTISLCRALCSPRPSWGEVSKILKGMKGKVDSETVRRAVLGYCTSIILNKGDKGVARVLEEFSVDTYATGFPGLVLAAYRALQ